MEVTFASKHTIAQGEHSIVGKHTNLPECINVCASGKRREICIERAPSTSFGEACTRTLTRTPPHMGIPHAHSGQLSCKVLWAPGA